MRSVYRSNSFLYVLSHPKVVVQSLSGIVFRSVHILQVGSETDHAWDMVFRGDYLAYPKDHEERYPACWYEDHLTMNRLFWGAIGGPGIIRNSSDSINCRGMQNCNWLQACYFRHMLVCQEALRSIQQLLISLDGCHHGDLS